MTTLAQVAERLSRYRPPPGRAVAPVRAAVALCLREGPGGIELLFIERARCEGDPWSGHLAFPGGRIDPGDADPRAAAERETREEVGLDLGRARYLGSLGTHHAERLPVVVSCFVYGLDGSPELRPNHEVAAAFWIPLADLLDPARHLVTTFRFKGRDWDHPAVRLLGPGRPVLWGITYRLVERFCRAVGFAFPPPGGRPQEGRP